MWLGWKTGSEYVDGGSGELEAEELKPVAAHQGTARSLCVLAYHGIQNEKNFACQLDYLGATAQPVTLVRVLDALETGKELPPRSVLITFDDGDRSILEKALPLLEERGLPAVTFVVAGHLDGNRPLWWQEVEDLHGQGATVPGWPRLSSAEVVRHMKRLDDEDRIDVIEHLRSSASGPAPARCHLTREDLRRMEAASIAVGNHSLTHPCLNRCSGEKILREVGEAHTILREAIGHDPQAFAYPNGDHDPRVRDAVRAVGYKIAFLFDHRKAKWPPEDPLRVSRLRVGSETSLQRFRLILSGLHPTIHHALGRP